MHTAVSLVNDQAVGAPDQDRGRLALVLHAQNLKQARSGGPEGRLSHLDDGAPHGALLHGLFCISQLGRCEGVRVGHGRAAQRGRDELYVTALDICQHHDPLFRQSGQRQVVSRITKNTFLNQEDIASRFYDRLQQVDNISTNKRRSSVSFSNI